MRRKSLIKFFLQPIQQSNSRASDNASVNDNTKPAYMIITHDNVAIVCIEILIFIFKGGAGYAIVRLRVATVARPEREKMAVPMKKKDVVTHSVLAHHPGPCGDLGRAAALPAPRWVLVQ